VRHGMGLPTVGLLTPSQGLLGASTGEIKTVARTATTGWLVTCVHTSIPFVQDFVPVAFNSILLRVNSLPEDHTFGDHLCGLPRPIVHFVLFSYHLIEP